MGSNGGGDGGGEPQPRRAESGGLGRLSSLYDLTLDEVQHQLGDLGKPLSSMNLDELLKSVWTAESNMNVDYSHLGQHVPGPSLARQSSINLAQDLRKKTVDEVWQGIQQGKNKGSNNSSGSGNNDGDKRGNRERQPTLGEMTLEDFLLKAGVVTGSGKKNVDVNQENANHQQAQWMQYQVAPIPQQHVYMSGHHPVQQSLSIGANPMMDMVYPETQMAMSPSHLMHNLSDTQTPGRKRVASGDVIEKTVERRQKRMIKNRESAARSRARKQAYTHELENKISRLEEENELLKRQKEVGMVLPSAPPPKPKYQLRRTSSASF
ncbi:putative transcription factor bZIP family [Helianthus annuus]|uniref:Transcription factor bZIP family n=2 Tax=Helianthus annuus TaxID=4232 RepID=A0A9K3IT03_HELAN|nr:ABSCISIC ACID-INSENSITIVE 5-like protein 2 [Helianthus annuus]XP_035830632.1 ABSCISIC ACID-INSENSITIVE 5-like protein 2 [Helianthus annuus]KAF5802455.1 putative transcription factor bZIP family [Helianthus annuus]KAJ0566959.1 putative transcription factor bZIP family [Helianthus annuus]KAJ0740847.1 putative transcription factor bZIP family [Helianthus annuus]KAJ0780323.1 putative transcription factor bZIP family [Helianthus annuus]KAJ0911938.1 putative transcription factor bZIP family [Hel